jgi:hypothetical protein
MRLGLLRKRALDILAAASKPPEPETVQHFTVMEPAAVRDDGRAAAGDVQLREAVAADEKRLRHGDQHRSRNNDRDRRGHNRVN